MVTETRIIAAHVLPRSDPSVCHTKRFPDENLTLCGMRSSDSGYPLHSGDYVDGYCTGCGKKACPTCEIMEWFP